MYENEDLCQRENERIGIRKKVIEEGILPRIADSVGLPVAARIAEVRGLTGVVLKDLTIGGEQPLLRAAQVEIELELKALVRGHLEIQSILVIEPELRIRCERSGQGKDARSGSVAEAPRGLPNRIKRLDIRGAVIHVTSGDSQHVLRVDELQILAKDLSLAPSAHLDGIAQLRIEYSPWRLAVESPLSFGLTADPRDSQSSARVKARLHAKRLRLDGKSSFPPLFAALQLDGEHELEVVLTASLEAQSIRIESLQSQFRSC